MGRSKKIKKEPVVLIPKKKVEELLYGWMDEMPSVDLFFEFHQYKSTKESTEFYSVVSPPNMSLISKANEDIRELLRMRSFPHRSASWQIELLVASDTNHLRTMSPYSPYFKYMGPVKFNYCFSVWIRVCLPIRVVNRYVFGPKKNVLPWLERVEEFEDRISDSLKKNHSVYLTAVERTRSKSNPKYDFIRAQLVIVDSEIRTSILNN